MSQCHIVDISVAITVFTPPVRGRPSGANHRVGAWSVRGGNTVPYRTYQWVNGRSPASADALPFL